MALTVDYSADYTHVDGVETVTLTPIDGSAAVATVKALRDQLSFREVMLGASLGIEPRDIIFVLFNATLGGNEPEGGSTIMDSSGAVWTILTATQRNPPGDQWRCICRKQV